MASDRRDGAGLRALGVVSGRVRAAFGAVILAASGAVGQSLLEWGWQADLSRAEAWHAEVTWQSDPAPGAACRQEGEALVFEVPEGGRGMKWSQRFPAVTFESCPYLVFRYRAEGLATALDNYLVYLEDRGSREAWPFRLRDTVVDGQWHTLAVDLRGVSETGRLGGVAVQVRAGAGPARLWVSTLRLAERPPAGALRVDAGAEVVAAPDWWADLAASAWEPRLNWLPNPDENTAFERREGTVVLRVAAAGRGMKWSWFLAQDFPLAGHAWLTLRYRATGSAPDGDYAVCIMGTSAADGMDYAPVVMPGQLRHDGLWHVLTVPLGNLPGRLPQVRGFALQVQAARDAAQIEVSRLGLTGAAAPVPAMDYLTAEAGALAEPFVALPVTAVGRLPLAEALQAGNVIGWPDGATVRVAGVPFVLPGAGTAVLATGIREIGSLSIPVGRSVSEVLLLTLGVYRGAEEDVYGSEGPLVSIAEVDRFSAEVRYADGGSERCFPCNRSAGGVFRVDHGAQVLCVFADRARTVREVILTDHSPGAAFVVPAVTCDTSAGQTTDPDQALPDLSRVTDRRDPATEPAVRSLLGLAPGAPWVGLWSVLVDGKTVPAQRFQPVSGDASSSVYRCREPALELRLGHRPVESEFAFEATLANLGGAPLRLGLVGPRLGPFGLGDGTPAQQWYWFPCAGMRLGNRPFRHQARYGGGFPLQAMGVFSPAADAGVYLRTLDGVGTVRDYGMEKTEAGIGVWIETCTTEVPAAGQRVVSPVRVGLTGGDWRTGFGVYREWLRSWYRPAAPRQEWFREVFNFRQRFLHGHDPLYDAQAGTYSLPAAIDEGAEQFGGIEYLHLFDWGSLPGVGRVYGRRGDVSPLGSFLKGGAPALHDAIAEVQRRGVRVGLYIEGYLLEEKGPLGQAHGKDWQIRRRDGERFYWPRSTEMMICSHVEAWRETQAATYAACVRDLGADGMYLDQFGFANPVKDCWSADHRHPVPGYSVTGEKGLSQGVRREVDAVREGVVLYGEEAPCDVNSQFMDGSFTYHMNHCRLAGPLAPLHPLRFAVPSFKTFEILVCDRPMGSWAEGVAWTFFNGEGIWLEGPAREWFGAQTLATIRRCHAILREHRAAFTSEAPVPLMPTLTAGVLANVFPAERETVMTLHNARHRSVVAQVPAPKGTMAGAKVLDGWTGVYREARPGAVETVVDVPMEPRGVGCLVFPTAVP